MGLKRITNSVDPLVRLLLAAIVLASILPVTGRGHAIASIVSDAAIFLLFLLNGLRLPRGDVVRGIGHFRFLAPLTLWCFVAMGALGWAMWRLSDGYLPTQVALGLLFLGLLPSTVQSATAYSSIAGGNVAASVVAAAVLNMLGVLITAPALALLAGREGPGIDLGGMERIGLILLLPFFLGQLLQGRAGHLVRDNKHLMRWVDRGAISFAVYVAFSGAVEQGLWTLVGLSDWAILLGLVAFYLVFGFGGAWLLGGALHLARNDRISFLFAGGQKSIALGAPLAAILFPPAVAGLLMLPLLTYHLTQMILSAAIAARLNPAVAE